MDEVDEGGEIQAARKPPSNHTIFAYLAAPFPRDAVRSRELKGERFHYVTARTVMNRLDEVLGPWNWSDHYEVTPLGVKCVLTVRLPDGREVVKEDVGGLSATPDASDKEKTAFTDAFKRAAVKFGVGRYLYKDGVPDFVRGILAAEAEARKEGRR
ncbi:Rad52/Rad22 family DNA repair protein [Paludisphaera soli]|uniref:Rad52/Rad22 family DNA repair protein n=1 Tax=Paludisphaera soli TaxID=2712865 RepID=UPI0013EA25AA|nr:Rad52/Rad22 family DNA repair protein [Paludisphaera soli]